ARCGRLPRAGTAGCGPNLRRSRARRRTSRRRPLRALCRTRGCRAAHRSSGEVPARRRHPRSHGSRSIRPAPSLAPLCPHDPAGYGRGVSPVEALERIAELLQRGREPAYRVQAFRRAAREVSRIDDAELRFLADNDRLKELPGVGNKTAVVIKEALAGETPSYLANLLEHVAEPGSEVGEALRTQLKGDLHSHSDWSDGGHTIRAMAEKARALGHEYLALTDHSPRLKVANGLTAERLRDQLDVVAELNEELAPFRILTGVEVDI